LANTGSIRELRGGGDGGLDNCNGGGLGDRPPISICPAIKGEDPADIERLGLVGVA